MARVARKLEEAPAPVKEAAKKKRAASKKAPPVDDADRYLTQLNALMKGKKDETFGFLADDGLGTDITEFIPTGSLAIDRLIGGSYGGWPVGRISECAAWEGVGKSTLLDQSMAECQRLGGIAALIDTEHARDEAYTRRMGVDTKKLITRRVTTIEEVFTVVDLILDVQQKVMNEEAKRGRLAPIMLIVWDSLGGTPTKAELEGDADDKHVAEAAKRVKLNLRRLTMRLGQLRAALVIANHFYQGIGPFASLTSYGGTGIRYFTSLRLWLTNKGKLKIGEREIGHIIQAKLKKTRVRNPGPPVETALIYGSGIDNSYSLYEWGQKSGATDDHRWIVKNGKWSYFMHPPDYTSAHGTTGYEAWEGGFVKLSECFRQHPELYRRMAEQYLHEGDLPAGGDVSEEEDDDDAEETGAEV